MTVRIAFAAIFWSLESPLMRILVGDSDPREALAWCRWPLLVSSRYVRRVSCSSALYVQLGVRHYFRLRVEGYSGS